MVKCLDGLHLSDQYHAHSINLVSTIEENEMENFSMNMSPQELEQKLKSAQRITVCKEIRKNLNGKDEIIPKVLLERIEKPCRALIPWIPPPTVERLVTQFASKENSTDQQQDYQEIEMLDETDDDDNNNNISDDNNNNNNMME